MIIELPEIPGNRWKAFFVPIGFRHSVGPVHAFECATEIPSADYCGNIYRVSVTFSHDIDQE